MEHMLIGFGIGFVFCFVLFCFVLCANIFGKYEKVNEGDTYMTITYEGKTYFLKEVVEVEK